MNLTRIIIIVAVVVIIAIVVLFVVSALLVTPTISLKLTWNSGAEYPIQLNGVYGVGSQSCVVSPSFSYIYCIGGTDYNGGPWNSMYASSQLSSSSSNITGWTSDPSYPSSPGIYGQGCVATSSDIYCVSGSYDSNYDDLASSYYVPISLSGEIGNWTATTSYPIAADSQSCVTSSGYIYCISGNNESDATSSDSVQSSSDYFAPVNSSGIGAWTQTTSYPSGAYLPSCVAYSGYVYCIGGADANQNSISTDYYAPISSTGIGAWTKTTSYPTSYTFQSCVAYNGNIYCVGGGNVPGTSFSNDVYYAPLSSSGIGSWKTATSYPDSAGIATECVLISNNIYCMGGGDSSSNGETGNVYYASLP